MTDNAIPAATLILMRERGQAPPHLLMVERARTMAFAAGAAVFPGGRIDPGDHALAEILAPQMSDAAARIAAIRETIEEAGLAPAITPSLSQGEIAGMRAKLLDGAPLGEVLAHDAHIDLSALTPFARWRPDLELSRVFDTHFFITKLPGETAQNPQADGSETVRLFWTSAKDALAAADRKQLSVIYPTRRNLERLALFDSHADAVADAHAHPVRTITPWQESREDGAYLCIPDDLGYPVTAERLERVRRG